MPRKQIDNTIFREKFKQLEEKEGLSLSEVAARTGWSCVDRRSGRRKPDSSRVARTLGLVAESGKHRDAITYENAVKLCKALHIDYCDAGV